MSKYYSVIYWYTTDLNRKDYRVKNGSARREANSALEAAEIRIKEQVTAKDSADPYQILYVEDVSDICETGDESSSLSKLRQLEKNWLHSQQKARMMWVPSDNKNSEWFRDLTKTSVNKVVDIGRELMVEYRTGIKNCQYNYPEYAYQEEITDSVVDRYNAGSRDVLIAAIMRSGKCFMTYNIARKKNFKKILVLTGKPGVNDSWEENLPSGTKPHAYFNNWSYNDYNKLKYSGFTPNPDKTEVLFVSLQYLNRHINSVDSTQVNENFNNLFEGAVSSTPQVVKDILSNHWDLVVFDEQHYATQTENTVNIIKQLNYDYKLELSGTPYKTLIQGRYMPEDIFTFDYIDEQKRRANGTVEEIKALEHRPDINWLLINVPEKVKSIINDEGFSFRRLLRVKNGEKNFEHHMSVTEFLNHVQKTVYKNPYNGNLSKFSPYVGHLNRHTLWVLPNSVKSISAMAALLKQHPYFGKYQILEATGNKITKIEDVKQAITSVDFDGSHSGVITLTCGRFLEGTTVPEWWTVHQMNDDRSAADYFQGSFRNKSEDKENDKRHVLVVDYSPKRFIESVYQVNLDTYKRKPGQSTTDCIREWCEVSDVFDYDGNQWRQLTGEEIVNRATEDIELQRNLMRGVGIDSNAIDQSIIDLMANKDRDSYWQATTDINDNDLSDTDSGKTSTGTPAGNKIKNPANDIKETTERIQTALCKITNTLHCTVLSETPIGSFSDICNYPDAIFIEKLTGLQPTEWKALTPCLPASSINQINSRIDALKVTLGL